MRCSPWPLASLCVLVAASADEGTCANPGSCVGGQGGKEPHYYWPSARGRPEHPSTSPYKGPKNLSQSLAWTWHHPDGQYAALMAQAPVIDGEKNLYLSTTEHIYKFSPTGRIMWRYVAKARMSDTPSIWNGLVFSLTYDGHVFALDMETGYEVWRAKPADGIGGDIASVTGHQGRVFASVGNSYYGGCTKVVCLNATDGGKLWEVQTANGLWNFIPMFPGDGNVIFQTDNGDPYAVRISDGAVMWTHVRSPLGWTDGGTIIGPNGVAYVVHADGHIAEDKLTPWQTSDISAYRVTDGKLLWRHHYGTPPNSWPVVARVGEPKQWKVLFPYGGQAFQSPVKVFYGWLQSVTGNSVPPLAFVFINRLYLDLGSWGPWFFKTILRVPVRFPWPGGITAFEPETGKVAWEWKLPDWPRPDVKGDDVGLLERIQFVQQGRLYGQDVCIPNPWASPTVDADGTLYTGWQDGILYAVRERNGVGEVVDQMQTTAAFSHPGIAMAPGMLAVANCDTLYVFRYDEE